MGVASGLGVRVAIGASRECRGHWGGRGIEAWGQWGCGGIGVTDGLGAQPHWAPVQGTSTPTGFPRGVTYLTKARQVTEMSSAGYYIHLALCSVTVCTFVSTPPNHIFLHAM